MVWLSVAAAIFFADSGIKHWAEKKLSDKAVREVAGDRILLRRLHNSGMACSVGRKTSAGSKGGNAYALGNLLPGILPSFKTSREETGEGGWRLHFGRRRQ